MSMIKIMNKGVGMSHEEHGHAFKKEHWEGAMGHAHEEGQCSKETLMRGA